MNLSPADWLRLAEQEATARGCTAAQVLAQWLAVANAGPRGLPRRYTIEAGPVGQSRPATI